jgi:hypothetical protein
MEWDYGNLLGDLAGFGTEVAMDPLTWVTGPLGTLTKEGKAAQALSPVAQAADAGKPLTDVAQAFKSAIPDVKAAGQTALTPLTYTEQIRKGERALAGLKAPRWINNALGMEDVPFATFGSGDLAANVFDAGFYGKYSPVPWVRGVFGVNTWNKWTGTDQKLADALYGESNRLKGMMEDLTPVVVRENQNLLNALESVANTTEAELPEIRRAIDEMGRKMVLENPKAPVPIEEFQTEMLKALNSPEASSTPWIDEFNKLSENYYGYFQTLRDTEDAMGKYAKAIGMDLTWLKDEFIDHYGRRPSSKVRGEMAINVMRSKAFRDVPEGTSLVNDVSRDPLLTAIKRVGEDGKPLTNSEKTIEGIVGKYKSARSATVPQPGSVDPATLDSMKNAGFGWKLHLTTQNQQSVSDILKDMGVRHKVGRGGGQTGKDITAYIGSKDEADRIASELSKRAGNLLDTPAGDVLKDDIEIAPNIMGRFDARGDLEFHQYGGEGIPFFQNDMDPWNKRPFDVAYSAADQRLREKYGDFYSGSSKTGNTSIPSIARKHLSNRDPSPFVSYRDDIERLKLKPWQYEMLPDPKDRVNGFTTLKDYQKHYLWDFHYKPALLRDLERKAGVEGWDEATKAAKYEEYAAKAWEGVPDEGIAPKLDEMVEEFPKLPAVALENGLFDRNTATDYFDYMNSIVKSIANMGYVHSALKQPGIMKLTKEGEEIEAGFKRLSDMWHTARPTKNGPRPIATQEGLRTLVMDSFGDQLGPSVLGTANLEKIRELRGKGATVEEIATELGKRASQGKDVPKLTGDLFLDELDALSRKVSVPEQTMGLLEAVKQISSPKVENKLLKFYDKVISGFKGKWTIPWPSFHMRNLTAAVIQEMTEGRIPVDALIRGKMNAARYLYDPVKNAGALKHIDEILSLEVLGKNWFNSDIETTGFTKVRDTLPSLKKLGEAAYSKFTGRAVERYGTDTPTLLQKLKANFDPLAARGVKDDIPANIVQDVGENLYSNVEFLARAGYYDELRRAGMSPSEAVAAVNRTHFNYANLNEFERGVMRRVFPFYSWTRKSLPYTMSKLLESPGGPTAQLFRAVNRGEDPEGVYTPKWMQEQVAAPMSGTPDAMTFMRSFGLPIEDYNRFVMGEAGLPNIRRTTEKFMADMAPPITMPLEHVFQKQLFSGRELKNLESPTENLTGVRVRPIDIIAARGPWSRAVSTVQDITNPKKPWFLKALNLTTGLKSSTVDTEKAKMIDAVNAQREKLDAAPEVRSSSYYYLNPRYAGTEVGATRQKDLALLKALERLQKETLKRERRP